MLKCFFFFESLNIEKKNNTAILVKINVFKKKELGNLWDLTFITFIMVLVVPVLVFKFNLSD